MCNSLTDYVFIDGADSKGDQVSLKRKKAMFENRGTRSNFELHQATDLSDPRTALVPCLEKACVPSWVIKAGMLSVVWDIVIAKLRFLQSNQLKLRSTVISCTH